MSWKRERRRGTRRPKCLPRVVECRSGQLHSLQTRMPVLADDDVIVHGDAERGGDVDDCSCHMNIRLGGRRIVGGVVVEQHEVRRIYV